MRPGADLFTIHGKITYTFILSLVLASLLILPIGVLGGKWVSRLITRVPVTVLAPFIFLLSVIGSYAINKNMFDVFAMLFFGLLGYVGRKIGFSPGPVVLGLILGDICEQGLVQSILMGRASGSILQMFFTRPISIVLIVLTLMAALWPVAQVMVRRRGSREKR